MFHVRDWPGQLGGTAGGGGSADGQRHLKAARRLAHLLDARWGVGPLRFGAETVLDLIPGVGDAASAAVSLYQLFVAAQFSLPRDKIGRMAVNIAIDLLLGFVPFAGDLADTAFKVHVRNQRIIDEHLGGAAGAL